MNELTDQTLYLAIKHTRTINKLEGQEILKNFYTEQPVLAETIFNVFPTLLAEKSSELAHLFMDLCFDTLCIYHYAFGKAPIQTKECLVSKIETLQKDLISLTREPATDRKKSIEVIQNKLLTVMKESIDEYAAESLSCIPYVELTQHMMTATLQLLEDMYNNKPYH